MSQLLSPETFEFFARYLLAGYIVIIARSRFIVGVRPRAAELVVEAVIFSLIVQVVWLGLAGLATATSVDQVFVDLLSQSSIEDLHFFAQVLILPTIIGALLGWNLTAGWKNALLRRLSMPVVHPVQRAHDWAFGVDRKAGFLLISYEDGTMVAGYFGEHSLASSDADRSDIFLERLYTIDENGTWTEPAFRRSGLVSLRGVRSIEFMEGENDVER